MADPSLQLRPATDEDAGWLRVLYATTRDDLAVLPLAEAQRAQLVAMQHEAQTRDYARRYGIEGRAIVLVGEEPIGQAWIHRGDDELRLVDVAFAPAHRGAGHGTALLGQLAAEAAARGVPLRLSVLATSPARRLYERLGFRRTDDAADAVYLEMELSQ